ncbi:MAG: peptidoglycan DD-metalloendopeptidase family protein [Eubacterium sp.]|nr:peptidoglycan DD-metalloendopeptidase family protein [Eubacterium sp.]
MYKSQSQQLYAQRARAMYVSGNMTTLEAILTSKDISTLLTRLEMIRRVSRQDKELLENLQNEGRALSSAQKELRDKKDSLTNNQQALAATQQTLTATVKNLEKQQVDFADKQKVYESEKSEADNLLVKIQEDTKNYSEFRHQSQEDIEEINREIEEAAQKYIKELEQQTTTATTTTTAPSTSARPDLPANPTNPKPSTTTTTTQSSSNKLSLTYPVPSQTRITTAYGSAGYTGHTGVDFACASGSNVVAAESGIVIKSTDITGHANGSCSCSYTGGGYHSYGRYIVIMHDKKNAKGEWVYTLYAHNSSRVVSEGQRVTKGQLIAYSGTTGNSSGPHCHFEVRTPTSAYEHCVNPTNYLP